MVHFFLIELTSRHYNYGISRKPSAFHCPFLAMERRRTPFELSFRREYLHAFYARAASFADDESRADFLCRSIYRWNRAVRHLDARRRYEFSRDANRDRGFGSCYAARGYDPAAVHQDRNALIPIDRLLEYQANAVIGKLNETWWSLCGYIPNAGLVVEELVPKIAERLARYEVQAALLIPASRLCHQTLGIIARGIEQSGIPTIMISVDKIIMENVRAPRTAYYEGELEPPPVSPAGPNTSFVFWMKPCASWKPLTNPARGNWLSISNQKSKLLAVSDNETGV